MHPYSTRIKKIEEYAKNRNYKVTVLSILNKGYRDAKSLFREKSYGSIKLYLIPYYIYAIWLALRSLPDRVLISSPLFLPLAPFYKLLGTSVIYSPHELEMYKVSIGKFGKWSICFIENFFLGSVDYVITVSDFIARFYGIYFHLKAYAVYNFPYLEINNKVNNQELAYDYIYIGTFIAGRYLEELVINVLNGNNTLCLIGFGPLKEKLQDLCAGSELVDIKPPISDDKKIIQELSKAKFGVILLDKSVKSLKYALPNKFFQYIHARNIVIHNDLFEINNIDRDQKLSLNIGNEIPKLEKVGDLYFDQEHFKSVVEKYNWQDNACKFFY